MLPAARIGDKHKCNVHGESPLAGVGARTVFICDQPAARVTDFAQCMGVSNDAVTTGCPTVFIEDQMAARQTDRTAHGGLIIEGCPTVLIGEPAPGECLKAAAASGAVFVDRG